MPSDRRIRRAMEQAAAAMNAPISLDDALRALTDGAVQAIPGASFASITTRSADGRLETVAATDPLIDNLDARQYELQEGPCYETATGEGIAASFDMSREPRWPRYGPIAAEAGFRGQLAVLLTENGRGRTTLNIYSADPHHFDQQSVDTAELFASHAAVAMGFVRTVSTLSDAVASRQTVGMAVGIVMERYQMDAARAFQFLVRSSSTAHVKLRDLAAQIVADHDGRTRL
jgi:hypothetical protein